MGILVSNHEQLDDGTLTDKLVDRATALSEKKSDCLITALPFRYTEARFRSPSKNRPL
ncbi:hypothetical protein MCOL2_07986 [Listeria fleischmannii FSL S10-1203]|uniref:Uncharacterized protein n=1 Tax=Listeria fleischmannii FSL S10-1203 TaxID=1265822 RepID=W7DPE1_9LIST|nr:hypothetical protein MCOL2_07986 [Listeria fleischmannii FSL S10-1203]